MSRVATSFRTRLLATYLVFVAAITGLGLWGAWRVEQAGTISRRLLSENYQSVVAAHRMQDGLERLHAAVLLGQVGQRALTGPQQREYRQRFDAALSQAAGNITEPGEREIIDDIGQRRDEYYRSLAANAGDPARVEPAFDALRARVDRLLQINQTAMLQKSAEADRWTGRALFATLALSLSLVIAGLAFAVRLSARIDREAERLKTEFVATASHELRTPLATLQMGIELLDEQLSPKTPDQQHEILAMCRQDTARLAHLVNDLLDLSRIESGRMQPVVSKVPAGMLVNSALQPSRARVEAKGIDLQVNVDSDLPPVLADSAQIERVLGNLVANAVTATPRGGRIDVAAHRADGGVEVSVSDTGHGIPPEYVPHLFEKFMQVPGRATGSAGLGLAISREIVRAHGGRIRAASEPGRGATFTFTLPAAAPSADSQKEHPS